MASSGIITPVTWGGMAGLNQPWSWAQRGNALSAIDMIMNDRPQDEAARKKYDQSIRETLLKPIGPGWEVGPGPAAYLRDVIWHTEYQRLGFDFPSGYTPVKDPGLVGENYMYEDTSRMLGTLSGPELKTLNRIASSKDVAAEYLNDLSGLGLGYQYTDSAGAFKYTSLPNWQYGGTYGATKAEAAQKLFDLANKELETIRQLSTMKPSEIAKSPYNMYPGFGPGDQAFDNLMQYGGGYNGTWLNKEEHRNLSYTEFQQKWQQASLDFDRLFGTNLGNQKTRLQNEERNIMDNFNNKYDTRKFPTLDRRRGASGGGVSASVTQLTGQQRPRVSSVTLLG